MFSSRIQAVAALLAAAAVAMGAFGAHGLKSNFDQEIAAGQTTANDVAKQLDNWKTAAQYHLVHSIGMFLAGSLRGGLSRSGRIAVASFLAGIALFCGGLYCYVLGGPNWVVHLVPFGGGAFILGWCLLACAAWHQPADLRQNAS